MEFRRRARPSNEVVVYKLFDIISEFRSVNHLYVGSEPDAEPPDAFQVADPAFVKPFSIFQSHSGFGQGEFLDQEVLCSEGEFEFDGNPIPIVTHSECINGFPVMLGFIFPVFTGRKVAHLTQ